MKLSTILDPRFPMSLRERRERLRELTIMTVAWHLPESVLYWAVIRGMVAVAGGDNPSTVTGKQILDRYQHALR